MKNRQQCLVALIFILYLLFHLYPIWRFGYIGFGYDTGIYRHYITGYFERLGDAAITPFGFANFSNPLMLLGDSVDTIMFVWYFFIAIGVFWAFYLVAREFFNKQVAMIAIFLFSVSATQFAFYWWYYYRNYLALFLLLITLLLVKKNSWLAIFTLIGIGIIHPLTLAPLGLAMLIYTMIDRDNRRFVLLSGIIAAMILFLINWPEFSLYLKQLKGNFGLAKNFSAAGRPEFSGSFITPIIFLSAILAYLPYGILGLWQNFRRQILLVSFFGANLFLVIIGFAFYRRFLVFLDLMLILFAAGYFSGVVQSVWTQKAANPSAGAQGKQVVVIFVVVLLAIQVWLVAIRQPLISDSEFTAIRGVDSLAGEYVLAIDSTYAPWLYGFTNKKIIAPGMLDYDLWDRGDWERFWFTDDNQERVNLLEEYGGQPIYIFVGERYRDLRDEVLQDSHFTKVNERAVGYRNFWCRLY